MKRLIDNNKNIVKIGDKIKGFGYLLCQDGYKIRREDIVTVNMQNNKIYFGNLSYESYLSPCPRTGGKGFIKINY